MHLVVLGFDEPHAAEQVFELVVQLATQDLVALGDVAWVERRRDGRTTLHRSMDLVAAGGTGTAMWDAAGEVGASLRPGGAAVIVLPGSGSDAELKGADLMAALRPYSPTVLSTDAPIRHEEELALAPDM